MKRARTRHQEDRLQRVLQTIRKRPGMTKRQLAQSCGVSERSIQRDLPDLQALFGAPITYCHRARGFVLEDPSWTFPHQAMSAADLVPFIPARNALGVFRGTGLSERLDSFVQRHRDRLGPTERKQLERLTDNVTFEDEPRRKIGQRNFHAVVSALYERRVLHARYASPVSGSSGSGRRVVIAVLHLAWIGGEWYVIGGGGKRGTRGVEVRRYALSRLRDARVGRPAPASVPRVDRTVEQKKRFLRFAPKGNGDVQRVKVRFTADAAPWVLEREWHRQQSVRRRKDGSILIDFPAPSLFEAFRWVMAWGPEAEVIGPKELRTAVAEAVRRMNAIYAATKKHAAPDDARELPGGLFR